MRRFIKPVAAICILLATSIAFAAYIKHNPDSFTQLRQTNPWLIAALLVLYGLFLVALMLVQHAVLALTRIRIPRRDTIIVIVYSTIINFFGPLQSGPGFRGIYLKKKFNISLKRYGFATLGYYACYALVSGLFIATGFSWQWWLFGGIVGAVAGCVLWKVARRRIIRITAGWQPRICGLLLLATFAQLGVMAIIYYVELHSLNSSITPHQAIIYAGAANFALFVSLTPGAIGFRESFVLFTEHLHHIPTATVVSASLLDRASYVVFLGLLVVAIAPLHLQKRLRRQHPERQADTEQK